MLAGALCMAALALAAPSAWSGSQPDRPAARQQAPALPAGGAAAAAHSNPAAYVQLERHLQRNSKDGRALVFKARMDMEAQRFELAAAGYQKALKVAPKVARDPGVWVEYAEARGMALGGTLLGEPERLLEKALALDVNHAQALDLAGSAAWERHDFALAARHWTRLLELTPPGSSRHAALAAAVERARLRAKVTLPPKL